MNYKLFALVIGLLLVGVVSASYTSQYPPAHNTTYVKATSSNTGGGFQPYYATDPSKSLIGDAYANVAWMSDWVEVNQRFHIDLGEAKPIKNIMYSNYHNSGTQTDRGIDNFTFWGSNTSSSFTTLTYATDTGWTSLTISQKFFTVHASSNTAELRNITVTNPGSYRYYAFKISDGKGTDTLAFRRVELQTEDTEVTPPAASFTLDRTLLRIPKIVTCTDTSTNTPTSWAWSWGDGTANSTTQNPTHTYTKRGIYTINMAATNAGGAGVATASSVRVVGYENLW